MYFILRRRLLDKVGAGCLLREKAHNTGTKQMELYTSQAAGIPIIQIILSTHAIHLKCSNFSGKLSTRPSIDVPHIAHTLTSCVASENGLTPKHCVAHLHMIVLCKAWYIGPLYLSFSPCHQPPWLPLQQRDQFTRKLQNKCYDCPSFVCFLVSCSLQQAEVAYLVTWIHAKIMPTDFS